MKILIIGGTRFIGPPVVQQLHALGHELTLFHRRRADLPPGIAQIEGDRRQLADWAGALREFAPDVVLDMIPFTAQDAVTDVQVFENYAGRLVALSSMDVYLAYDILRGVEPGPPVPVPMTEDAPLRRRLYPYRGETPRAADDPQKWADDYDKIPVERVVMGTPGLPGTLLRLPMVYGPADYQHRLFDYLKRMRDGRPAILLDASTAAWRTSRGYVENVAAAIARAVVDERARGRVYNVAEAEALTEAAWVRAIGAAAGWTGRVVELPSAALPSHLRFEGNPEQHLVASAERIRRELDYREPVSLTTALVRTLFWEQNNPPPFDPAQFDYAAEDAALGRM